MITRDDTGRRLARGIAFAALLLFAVLAPLLPGNTQKVYATLLAGILLIPACYTALRTGEPIGRTPLDIPAIAFLLVASLATVFSVNPLVSLIPSNLRGDGLLTYIAYIALALAAARLREREARGLIFAILAGGSLIGAIAVAQYYGVDVTPWLGSTRTGLGRSWATLGNADFLGGYVSLVLPIALVVAAQAPARRWWGPAAACTLLYGALLASETRAAWAASAGAAVLLWLLRGSFRAYRRLAFLAVVFAAVTLGMVSTRPSVSLAQRAVSTFNPQGGELQQRLYIWERTLPLIVQRPLFGWGFSTLSMRLPGMGSPEYARLFGHRFLIIDATHNEILHIAYSTGLAGLAAYLWVWATVLRSLVRSLNTAAAGIRLEAGFIAGLSAYFVWLQLAWSHIGTANVFWAVGGGAVALVRASSNRLSPASWSEGR